MVVAYLVLVKKKTFVIVCVCFIERRPSYHFLETQLIISG